MGLAGWCFLLLLGFASVLAQDEVLEGSGEGSGEVFEEQQQPAPIDPPSAPCELDLTVLLDASGSMRGEAFERQVGWANSIVQALNVGRSSTRIAAVMFTGYAHTEFNLNTYFSGEDIQAHLKSMRFRSGVTRTGNALRQAKSILNSPSKGARPRAHKIVVLFSDGLSIDDPVPTAKELRDDGVLLLSFSVAKNSYMPELLAIAGEEEGVFKQEEMERLLRRLAEEEKSSCSANDPLLPVLQPDPASELSAASTLPPVSSAVPITASSASSLPTTAILTTTTTATAAPLLEDLDEGSGEGDLIQDLVIPVEPAEDTKSIMETNITTVGSFAKDTKATIKVTLTTTLADATTTVETPTVAASDALLSAQEDSAATSAEELAVQAFTESAPANSEVRLAPGVVDPHSPFQTAECQTDFAVLLDSSGSVRNSFAAQRQLIRDLVDLIDIGPHSHRLALMQFAGKRIQKLNFPFAAFQAKASLARAVEGIRPILAGTTYLGQALQRLREVLELRRPSARLIVVVVSDGYSQDDVGPSADALRSDFGAEVLAVSVASPAQADVLEAIAGSPSGVFVGADQARHFLRLLRSAQSCIQ